MHVCATDIRHAYNYVTVCMLNIIIQEVYLIIVCMYNSLHVCMYTLLLIPACIVASALMIVGIVVQYRKICLYVHTKCT